MVPQSLGYISNIFLLLKDWFLTYTYVVCLCAWNINVATQGGLEKGPRFLEAGVLGVCEPLTVGLGLELRASAREGRAFNI